MHTAITHLYLHAHTMAHLWFQPGGHVHWAYRPGWLHPTVPIRPLFP